MLILSISWLAACDKDNDNDGNNDSDSGTDSKNHSPPTFIFTVLVVFKMFLPMLSLSLLHVLLIARLIQISWIMLGMNGIIIITITITIII